MNGTMAARRTIARRGSGQTLLVRVVDQILLWQERGRSRRALAALDDRMLHDVGLDRATAHDEAARGFWNGR
jgi:uncharacterized protein YjiS (DUF1127 family)